MVCKEYFGHSVKKTCLAQIGDSQIPTLLSFSFRPRLLKQSQHQQATDYFFFSQSAKVCDKEKSHESMLNRLKIKIKKHLSVINISPIPSGLRKMHLWKFRTISVLISCWYLQHSHTGSSDGVCFLFSMSLFFSKGVRQLPSSRHPFLTREIACRRSFAR